MGKVGNQYYQISSAEVCVSSLTVSAVEIFSVTVLYSS